MQQGMPTIFARALLALTFVASGFAGLAPSALAADALTNDAIVEMVKVGLSEDVIKAKIAAGPTFFDTSTPSLAKLQKAGVSSNIVAAMINAGAAAAKPAASSPAAAAFGVAPAAGGSDSQFYYGGADAQQRIKPTRVVSEFSNRKAWIPFAGMASGYKPEVFLFIEGQRSSNALSGADAATFRTSLDPLSLRLVKLGEHKKRHDRFIVFQGSYSDREIQFDSARDESGLYSISVPKHLDAGEYAFLYNPTQSVGGFWAFFGGQQAGTALAFDFGVH